MSRQRRTLGDRMHLLALSARMLAGKRYWLAALAPLVWTAGAVLWVLVGWRQEDYTPSDAQNLLMAIPLTILAIGLGVRIIAGEIDRRTLEIAYTVPGGAHRVWLNKLVAAASLVMAAEIPVALGTYLFCTEYSWGAIYGALQGALFYLALAMSFAALFRSETAGALVTVVALLISFPFQEGDTRLSPFWNPTKLIEADPQQLLAWTAQNRIGFAIAIVLLVVLACLRAENRESLLSA